MEPYEEPDEIPDCISCTCHNNSSNVDLYFILRLARLNRERLTMVMTSEISDGLKLIASL
jgi:hypothetical protein